MRKLEEQFDPDDKAIPRTAFDKRAVKNKQTMGYNGTSLLSKLINNQGVFFACYMKKFEQGEKTFGASPSEGEFWWSTFFPTAYYGWKFSILSKNHKTILPPKSVRIRIKCN